MIKQTLIPLSATENDNLLLVVEDSEEDYEMFQRSVKRSKIQCNLYRCETGDDALRYLGNQGEYQDPKRYKKPTLILLDLNLPGTDGQTVLRRLKADDYLKLIPIVIFTTSSNPKDLEACYHNGANGYVLKPLETAHFQENIKVLLEYWLYVNVNYTPLGLNFSKNNDLD
jgi:CheY-like chemotaxis protein